MDGQAGHQNASTSPLTTRRKPYDYKGLHTTGIIRILRLEPGTGDDPLRGELYQTELHDRTGSSPNFEALSYVWGIADYEHTLHTPDGFVKVSTNLARALRRIRLPDRIRRVWADAVCINQKDSAERGHQVKMMGQVYLTARRVLIWLGPDLDCKAGHIFAMASDPGHTSTKQGIELMREALTELLRCEWFSRIWVVQEYHLARSARCMWGDEHIDFNYLLHAIRAAFRTDEGCPLWVVLQRRSFTVANILSSTRGLQCADERDRVFATLGLPYDKRFTTDLIARIRQIEPNYALSVGQTMIEYARAFIECSYTNLLLAQVCHGSTIDSHINTPSWLPNLGMPSPGQFVPLGTGLLIADKSMDLARRFADRLDVDTQLLYLKGWERTDTISTVGPSMDPEATGSRLEDIAAFWEQKIYAYRKSVHPSLYRLYERRFTQVLVCQNWDVKLSVPWESLHAAITANTGQVSSNTMTKNATRMLRSLKKSVTSRVDYEILSFFRPPQTIWKQRRLVKSAEGFVGMAPLATAHGDIVALFPHFDSPLVLRRRGKHYQFVGTIFMPGLRSTLKGDEDYRTFEIE